MLLREGVLIVPFGSVTFAMTALIPEESVIVALHIVVLFIFTGSGLHPRTVIIGEEASVTTPKKYVFAVLFILFEVSFAKNETLCCPSCVTLNVRLYTLSLLSSDNNIISDVA